MRFAPPATGEGTPRYLWALAAASGIAVAGLFLVIGLTRARRRTGTSPPVPTTGPERQPIQSSPPT